MRLFSIPIIEVPTLRPDVVVLVSGGKITTILLEPRLAIEKF